jgi:hypothetical protein
LVGGSDPPTESYATPFTTMRWVMHHKGDDFVKIVYLTLE